MKKKICCTLFSILIIVFLLGVNAGAVDSTDEVIGSTTEDLVETPNEPPAEPPEENQPNETPSEAPNETPNEIPNETPSEDVEDKITAEDVEQMWRDFKGTITDSATWTMIGAALLAVISNSGIVGVFLKKIMAHIGKKADGASVEAAIKELKKALTDSFVEHYNNLASQMKRYEDALKQTDENEQKMYAILTLFMTNCKLPESARAEIMAMISGVKKYDYEKISDILEDAQESINKTKTEAIAIASPTPTLDKLLAEEADNDYMKLG